MNEHITKDFDWGRIEWLYEPQTEDTSNLISIGLQTILPGKMQTQHIHHGDEQVLYVLSGTGRQAINGRESLKSSGSIFHIVAGSVHETENTGDAPLRELIISIPANHETHMTPDAESFSAEILQREFFDEVEKNPDFKEIFRSFTGNLGLPVAYFNRDGKAVIRAKNFPDMCQRCRAESDGSVDCAIYGKPRSGKAPRYTEPTVFVCRHGLSIILSSVVCGKEQVGMIKGGHIRIAPEDVPLRSSAPARTDTDFGPSDTQFYSKARVKAILKQFERLSREVSDYYNARAWSFEANRRELTLQRIINEEETLRQTLRSKTEQVLNIRINNHFLFNTLNAIGSMAVAENAFHTYDSILNLSNMFRYTLRTDNRLVRLSDEIRGLMDYLDLQKLRFGDSVRVNVRIPEEIGALRLPFHCLQPIVENAFIHGYNDGKKPFRVTVSGKRIVGGALIAIEDSGSGMEKEALRLLRTAIKNNDSENPSGLAMTYEKLKLYYEDDFAFKIKSAPKGGLRVEIILPGGRKREKKGRVER
jgi:quercetin dioxygenase-like cupin family protein/ligand-binding sensor protein